MTLKQVDGLFSVCKLPMEGGARLPEQFCFTGRTDEEFSLVCRTQDAPAEAIAREDGWRALRIEGVLDFSLIGVLAKVTALLAAAQIGVFVVSTYNTDYVLVKDINLARARKALSDAGYEIR